jgi:DNA-binding transcriptional regulator LsrR (DeoR family)
LPRPAISEPDQVYAAYLYAQEGQSQAEIAAELKVSPAVISRVLDRVRGRFYKESRQFLKENLPEGLREGLENRLAASDLGKALNRVSAYAVGRAGPRVRVFRVGGEPERESEQEWTARLEKFTRMAAPSVWDLLSRARLCGVTWGGTLATLVRAGKTMAMRPSSGTEFIPLAGEPLGFAPTTSSSSLLADELQQMFRGDKSHAKSLTMLPALIPRDFSTGERLVIEKLIERLKDYEAIFLGEGKDNPPLAECVDGIITSVGPKPLGFAEGRSLLDDAEGRFFVGDLGGVLLPKNQADPAQIAALEAFMKDFDGRWKGLRLDHVRKCADAAAKKDAAPSQIGVVVVCMGDRRAPAVFEGVKNGLISHLFVDEFLEKALLAECESRSKL